MAAFKPPLGCKPRDLYLRERIEDLSRSIHQYSVSEGTSEEIAWSILKWGNEIQKRIVEFTEITISTPTKGD